uniref:Uncharacterized protein n=1 Tax=Arundo donax TaxID=35708 RepID=A0A0A8XW40_ARUDO
MPPSGIRGRILARRPPRHGWAAAAASRAATGASRAGNPGAGGRSARTCRGSGRGRRASCRRRRAHERGDGPGRRNPGDEGRVEMRSEMRDIFSL